MRQPVVSQLVEMTWIKVNAFVEMKNFQKNGQSQRAEVQLVQLLVKIIAAEKTKKIHSAKRKTLLLGVIALKRFNTSYLNFRTLPNWLLSM